jgi:hypothetical protein
MVNMETKKAPLVLLLILGLTTSTLPTTAHAGSVEQAKRLHDRLAGVPPSATTLAQMDGFIKQGNVKSAALLAMDNDNFYNIMLKNWFSTWTNVDGSPLVDLNDYSATAMGLIRDNVSFDQVLYGDIIYVGDDSLVSTLDAAGAVTTKRHLTPYQKANNQHYIDLQNALVNPANIADYTSTARIRNISLKQYLVRKQQTTVTGIAEVAGVLTTRAAGAAFFSAGTNRRAVRFALKNFLCMDMENLQDTTRPDFRVRRDVDRAPGGDSRTYKQTCVGCHAGMDALAGAFAYFNFSNNQVTHTPGAVQAKYNQNNTVFPGGFTTTDNSWINLWIAGPNASIGWNGADSGSGAKAFGQLLSQTNAFSSCMVKRVFKRVCLRDPNSTEALLVSQLASEFAAQGRYNMKDLLASVATLPQCMGE